VLKHDTPILNLILNVVIVDIDVFSALIVALACYELDRGLVVVIELNRTNVVAVVANLLQQAGEPGSFFSGVGKANVTNKHSRYSLDEMCDGWPSTSHTTQDDDQRGALRIT